MALTINTNVNSLNAQRNLSMSQSSLSTSMQRLSSGLRVNSAKDDAAGLAIAERMSSQVRGMNVAIRNANDGISMSQTAEGALGKVADSLQRMRELTVQAANVSNSTSDKVSIGKEYSELAKEITRVIAGTTFNGTAILATAVTQTFQVGPGTTANDVIDVVPTDFTATAGLTDATAATITGTTDNTAANGIITLLDTALDTINSARASMGATQSRFDSVIANLQVSVENQSAARSRIMDADFAAETANLSRAQILQQAGNAMVAQANQQPQQVMTLLR